MTDVEKAAPGVDPSSHIQNLIRPAIENFGGEKGAQDLAASPEYKKYQAAAEELAGFDPFQLETREQRLTFWINIYNVTAILSQLGRGGGSTSGDSTSGDSPSGDSPSGDSPSGGSNARDACNIGGAAYSLVDIEYGILRSNARRPYRPWRHFPPWDRRRRLTPDPPEPLVNFALLRPGSNLRPRFYEAVTIDRQLHDDAVEFLGSGGVVIDPVKQTILLAPLLRDCAADFGGGQGLMRFIASHLEPGGDAAFVYSRGGRVDIKFQK
ncbi:MAG: DUF547 domain-containing protein [Actinobacteria bacterium]|nr:DUF547 domain-containing protein [Actinomycetota bacterium]